MYRFLILLLLTPSTALCAPAITDVTGDFVDKGVITISGASFGGGPTVRVYETFDQTGKVDGEDSTVDGPRYGSWTTVDSEYPIQYSNVSSVSGVYAGLIYGWRTALGKNKEKMNSILFPETMEVFISFYSMIPDGTHHPGTDAVETFPAGSSWKFTWLQYQDNYTNNNLCLPTFTGNPDLQGGWQICGNDSGFCQYVTPLMKATWEWGGWMRYTSYIKGNEANPTTVNAEPVFFQGVSETGGYNFLDLGNEQPMYKYPEGASSDRINVPGWIASDPDGQEGIYNNVKPLYDDIYIATGDNAQARVELGNTPVYSDSTKLSILIPTTWSTGSITATVNEGLFVGAEDVYVHVIDSDGSIDTSGPYTMGDTPPPSALPFFSGRLF